jgi:hypothetical protein
VPGAGLTGIYTVPPAAAQDEQHLLRISAISVCSQKQAARVTGAHSLCGDICEVFHQYRKKIT